MIAISSFLAIVAVSLLVTRIATVVLVATGMSRESARFQARSALTGSGFTTKESEAVVDHPVRRRVIMTLMLLGNAGLVAAATSLILGFRGAGRGGGSVRVLVLVGGLLALVYVSRSRWVERRLTEGVARVLRCGTDLPSGDLANLAHLGDGYVVAELAVREGDWAAGRRLADLRLRSEGIVVLGVNSRDGNYVAGPRGGTVLRPEDVLIVYGHQTALRELDDRRAADRPG